MSIVKCPHCPRTFKCNGSDGMAKGRLAANLANHIKGAHPDKYKPSKWVIDRLARKEKDEAFERAARFGSNPIKPQILISGPDPEPVKRPYNRQPKLVKSSDTVCFCPKCGCNIRAVQVAMGL